MRDLAAILCSGHNRLIALAFAGVLTGSDHGGRGLQANQYKSHMKILVEAGEAALIRL